MRYVLTLFILSQIILINAQTAIDLKEITVLGNRDPDTVFGTWKYSVCDFEFSDDRLIILTFDKKEEDKTIRLVDASQKVLSSFRIPDVARELYKDYMGYINVMCKEHIYRVKIDGDKIGLISLPAGDFRALVMPCVDTIENSVYFSDFQPDYPQFSYYAYNRTDSVLTKVKTVSDAEILHGYNMEYYFLKPKERLQARNLADYYGVDKHRVAANISGLTSSVFYTPLYSPLYIIRDTAMIFDHCSNAILKYNKQLALVDSVPVNYHHPVKWKEWKNKLIADKETGKVYAVYQRSGFTYLKEIDLQTGKLTGSFKLIHRSADRLKIRNGYVYYVYRPFESLQEKFVYKDLIRNN
ncbi:MAG: hypothetical protein M3R27_02225 [Bacteroidota bacterium]|nr:hypothetical protein [Bacteroidota bacterium]